MRDLLCSKKEFGYYQIVELEVPPTLNCDPRENWVFEKQAKLSGLSDLSEMPDSSKPFTQHTYSDLRRKMNIEKTVKRGGKLNFYNTGLLQNLDTIKLWNWKFHLPCIVIPQKFGYCQNMTSFS